LAESLKDLIISREFMERYNPFKSKKYFGKRFVTERGTEYKVLRNGRFLGLEESIMIYVEGIAGVDIDDTYIKSVLQNNCKSDHPEYKRDLNRVIKNIGLEPREGLRMIVSFYDGKFKNKIVRCGAITSHIREITDL
jgi:hypothetical protein